MALTWRLHIDKVDLPILEGGYVGLSCSYSLGPFLELPPEGAKVKFAGCSEKEDEEQKPAGFERGDLLCVYLLHYGRFIKIGTSRFSTAAARMLSQAPFMGVVAAVIELRSDCNYEPESIERKAVEEARRRGLPLKQRRPKLSELVELWGNPPRGFVEQLERAEEEGDPTVVEGVEAAVEAAVRAAKLHGDLLWEPALHWFTTNRRVGPVPPPLENVCKELKEGQEVAIKPCPNGMLILEAEGVQRRLTGEKEHACTYHELREVLFEVML
ncbi:MAG: hypothetical protein QXJ59_08120 [Thermofilaceae archaeon]